MARMYWGYYVLVGAAVIVVLNVVLVVFLIWASHKSE
jgi:hypothetical protein